VKSVFEIRFQPRAVAATLAACWAIPMTWMVASRVCWPMRSYRNNQMNIWILIFKWYTYDFLSQLSKPASFRISQTDHQDEGHKDEDLVEVHDEIVGLLPDWKKAVVAVRTERLMTGNRRDWAYIAKTRDALAAQTGIFFTATKVHKMDSDRTLWRDIQELGIDYKLCFIIYYLTINLKSSLKF